MSYLCETIPFNYGPSPGTPIVSPSDFISFCTSSQIISSLSDARSCLVYRISCVDYVPPSLPSSSSQFQYSSSGSVECPSGGEFDWGSVSAGFVDAFPVFAAIFGVWCIVKVIRMAWWGAK